MAMQREICFAMARPRAIAGAQLTVGAGDGCGVAVRRGVGEEGGWPVQSRESRAGEARAAELGVAGVRIGTAPPIDFVCDC